MISKEEAKERFQGVCVPIATIYKGDLSLDLDGLASNVQWMIDRGAKQGNTIFLIAGSGGDFTVLNVKERKQVIKTVAAVNAGRVPTMAGVQTTDIRDTIELCQFGESVGIEIAQISSAYYYDPKPDDVVAWHEEVARHTGIGFSAYSHWYSGSKYDVPVDLIERLLEIPNTNAVKWSSPNMKNYIEGMRRFVGKAAVVNNNAPLVVYSQILGARAWVSHLPNFFPEFCWMVHDLMEEKRFQEAQKVYAEFMGRYAKLRAGVQRSTAGEGIFVKPGMEAVGLVGGPSRLPSRDAVITPEVREGYTKLLAETEVLVPAPA